METPEQVKNAARAAAAAKINALFVDPAKLNDIGRLKSDYQQMLSVVDSEIRSVQDAKLAAAGQVQDTLEAVHGQMRRLRDQHEELSSLVSYCQGLLAPYPKIREASAARQNLREVLAYIERFNTSIDLVDDLERVVDEPLMLMELWKEMQRLLEWRNFMLERLRVAEVDARASTSDRSEEQEHFVAMLAFVGEQFARVANLRNSMVDKLLAIVEEQVAHACTQSAHTKHTHSSIGGRGARTAGTRLHVGGARPTKQAPAQSCVGRNSPAHFRAPRARTTDQPSSAIKRA